MNQYIIAMLWNNSTILSTRIYTSELIAQGEANEMQQTANINQFAVKYIVYKLIECEAEEVKI